MPKRFARKPSTRSLRPATRNRMKAIRISPDVIAHRITGTARMRASVIRLGMLKPSPQLLRRAERRARRKLLPEYSGAQAIAQCAIVPYHARAHYRGVHA